MAVSYWTYAQFLSHINSGNGNESENGKAGEAGVKDATASGKSPATGDSNAMAMLFGTVTLSGAGMFVTMKKKKTVK